MKSLKEFKDEIGEKIRNSGQVFIVPHNEADLDAIASSIAMSYIVRKLGKPVHIILNDEPLKIEPGVKMVIDECRKNISLINLEQYRRISSDNDLLIACDVNKRKLVCCGEDLDKFKDIILIDHHRENEDTIKTDTKWIQTERSSASEILADLLCLFQIKADSFLAKYLLAGIYLDTNKLTRNIGNNTKAVVERLKNIGIDLNHVDKYFEEDFNSAKKVYDLVSKSEFYNYTIALCAGDEDTKYLKEELAKAADYLLRYKVDASFAVGKLEDGSIAISARSKGDIDVGEIMGQLEGGGNMYSAATRLQGREIEDTVKTLKKIYKPSFQK